MRPIRGARVNRLSSNATKRPIRGRELIKVRDLFKEIRYIIYRTRVQNVNETQFSIQRHQLVGIG